MILGRSTPQWVALIGAAAVLVQVLIVNLAPGLDPAIVATVIGSVVGFLNVFLAFLAGTSTTPTSDPQLKAGTLVRVTDEVGTMIGHAAVPSRADVQASRSASSVTTSLHQYSDALKAPRQ